MSEEREPIVERSAFVGLLLLVKDLIATLLSRGLSVKYQFDPGSRQHYFEFHVHGDAGPRQGPHHDPRYDHVDWPDHYYR